MLKLSKLKKDLNSTDRDSTEISNGIVDIILERALNHVEIDLKEIWCEFVDQDYLMNARSASNKGIQS